jgi:hypothetical protein
MCLDRQSRIRYVQDSSCFIANEADDFDLDGVAETGMVPGAKTYHASHIEHMKMIPSLRPLGNVTDETLQCASTPEHSNEQVTRIDLREPPCWQLEHVIGRAVSECANGDYVTGARRCGCSYNRESLRQRQWRSG